MSSGLNQAHLKRFDIGGFRNFIHVDIRLTHPWVGIVGRNGAGKTNLLEAVHLICRQRGFRDEPPAKLAPWDGGGLSLQATFTGTTGSYTRGLAWDAQRGLERRTDGDPATTVRSWVVAEPIFGYRPDDDLFFYNEPKQRRKYLDWFCAYADPGYMGMVTAYEQALRQRNALLRGGGSGQEWSAWDAELAECGACLTAARFAAATHLAAAYAELWRGHSHAATLRYRSGGSHDSLVARERLAQTRQADCERGWTGFGPHRDDITIELDGRPIRESGSQGYRKLGVLLLALACAAATPATRLFYLDDFEGELDADNEAYVYDRLRQHPLHVWLSGVRRPQPLAASPDIEWIELREAPMRTLRYGT